MPVSLYLAAHTERTRNAHRPGWSWLLSAAVVCALNAGFVNAVCLESGYRSPVSHMTGAASHLSLDLVHADGSAALSACGVIFCFLAGSVLCGVIIGGVRLMPGRAYGLGLLIESILLAAATVALMRGAHAGLFLAAAACGLQNALATSHCGLVLRTTHVTGIVTDLGILLGHWLRHGRREPWKLLLLVSLLSAFVIGGALGALAFTYWGVAALGLAAVACGAAALAYTIWQRRRLSGAPLG